jgi:hypothetical protein
VKVAAAALVVVSVLVVACGTGGGDRLAALKAMPEATLLPAQSSVITDLDYPAGDGIEGPSNAETGHLAGTASTPRDVISFYNTELGKTGWKPSVWNDEPLTTESSAMSWEKDTVVLRLSFTKRGDDPRLPSAQDQARFPTIFRVVLIDHADVLGPPSS